MPRNAALDYAMPATTLLSVVGSSLALALDGVASGKPRRQGAMEMIP